MIAELGAASIGGEWDRQAAVGSRPVPYRPIAAIAATKGVRWGKGRGGPRCRGTTVPPAPSLEAVKVAER